MKDLKLADAYARYGAKVARGQQALSAIAADGAMVLTCQSGNFDRPNRDILRYKDALSSDRAGTRHKTLLGQSLTQARAGGLTVRLVIVTPPKGPLPRIVSVRPDLVGKVTEFDGDQFVVDFSRIEQPPVKAVSKRKR